MLAPVPLPVAVPAIVMVPPLVDLVVLPVSRKTPWLPPPVAVVLARPVSEIAPVAVWIAALL